MALDANPVTLQGMLLFNLPGSSATPDGKGERIFWACLLVCFDENNGLTQNMQEQSLGSQHD